MTTSAALGNAGYASHLRDNSVHWAAVGAYALLCAIGSVSQEAGAVLLILFAVGASLRALFRNAWMIALMLLAAGLGTVFPPVGIAIAVIAAILFLRRISFLLDHAVLIGLGLVVYGAAIVAILAGKDFASAAVAWAELSPLRDESRLLVTAFGSGAISAALLHRVLLSSYRRGYTTATTLEIMSMIPLLLLSLIMPLLKLHFSAEVPVEAPVSAVGVLQHGHVDGHAMHVASAPEAVLGHASHAPQPAVPLAALHHHHSVHVPEVAHAGHHSVYEPVHPTPHLSSHPPGPLAPPPTAASGSVVHAPAPVHLPQPLAPIANEHTSYAVGNQMFHAHRLGNDLTVEGGFGSHADPLKISHGPQDVIYSKGHVVGNVTHDIMGDHIHPGSSPVGGSSISLPDATGTQFLRDSSGLDVASAKIVNGQWVVRSMRGGPLAFGQTYPAANSATEAFVLAGFRPHS